MSTRTYPSFNFNVFSSLSTSTLYTLAIACLLVLLLYLLCKSKYIKETVERKESHVNAETRYNARKKRRAHRCLRSNANRSKNKKRSDTRLKNKKMASDAPAHKSNCNLSNNTNTKVKDTLSWLSHDGQPVAAADTSTNRLKRRSQGGSTGISDSLPYKRQSPQKSNFKGHEDFSHPVFKKISSRNGEINRMTQEQLKSSLRELNLDPCGYPDILKKRLKLYYSQTALGKAGVDCHQTQNYDYLCVIDFEATCEQPNPADYLHEIIEFPIVLVNTKDRHVEDTLMLFCKPLHNPKLSEFCTRLTNITQRQVDYADTFPVVLDRVNRWIKDKELGSKYSFAIVTDGPWDINLFLRMQCKLSQVTFPPYAKTWINLSKTFSNFYKTNRVKLELMLKNLGMEFEGRPHRGIDDAKNIARIAVKLMEDGCNLTINERLT